MVKNYKKAFNLAEVLLAMAILSIIIGLVIQSAKKQLPDMNKMRFKNAYIIIEKTIESMLDDENLYPNDTELADTSPVSDVFYAVNPLNATTNTGNTENSNTENTENNSNSENSENNNTSNKTFTYGGNSKFREIFIVKANAIKKDINCAYYTSNGSTGSNSSTSDEKGNCFKVTNGILFGIPDTDFINTNVIIINGNKYVPITIYTNHSDKSTLNDAFVVGVSYNGNTRVLTNKDSSNISDNASKAKKYLESETHKKE